MSISTAPPAKNARSAVGTLCASTASTFAQTKRSAYQMTTATTVSCSTLPINDARDAPVASAEIRYATGINVPAARSQLLGTRRVPLLKDPMPHASVATTVRMIASSIFAPTMLAHATGTKKKGRSAQRRSTDHHAIFSAMPEFRILVSKRVYHAQRSARLWKKLPGSKKDATIHACVRQSLAAQAARGKSGLAHISQEIWRTVAGNARLGNPRDANRDADAERLGTLSPVGNPTGLGELHGNMEVQRQNSYLRARSCPTPVLYKEISQNWSWKNRLR